MTEEGTQQRPDVVNLEEVKKDRPYTIRKLRDGDTYVVGGMVSSLLKNRQLQYAFSTGDRNAMIAAGVGAAFAEIPRELALFVADLVGIRKDFKLKDWREKDNERQRKQVHDHRLFKKAQEAGDIDEDELPPLIENLRPIEEIQEDMEEEIIERVYDLPPGSTFNIIAEVMERKEFEDFIDGSQYLTQVVKGLSGRFGTQSSNDSD